MKEEKLHQLTTLADRLHCTFENGDTPNRDTLSHFVDEMVDFLEALGGRVNGVNYVTREGKNVYKNRDDVIIHAYVDQLIPNENGRYDTMGSCWFIVPSSWAETQAKYNFPESSLEEFLDDYIYDNVDGWLQKAIEDGVLQGAGIGRIFP